MAKLELFGAARCPHTQEMREWLEWIGHDYVKYDVDADVTARQRMRAPTRRQRSMPVLIEGEKVVQVGWKGRSCMVEAE